MGTQALATFGVYGRPGEAELAVLALADEYRAALCELHQQRHNATTNFRNERFPVLWRAMVEWQAWQFRVKGIEREIKALHSEVRDRNAVPLQQRQSLHDARARVAAAKAAVVAGRAEWAAYLARFRRHLGAAADWKNVKSLARRREAYAAIQWPEEFRDFATFWLANDLVRRELALQYQQRGLHSAIRAEIGKSSWPKYGDDGPGMRYFYGRAPVPEAWQNLSLHFVGGITLDQLIARECPSLWLQPVYTNHTRGGDEVLYRVRQQIGTRDVPRVVEYGMKLDKRCPTDAVFQRWLLAVSTNGKRAVVPTVKSETFDKPLGEGTLTYTLTWTRVLTGVQVSVIRGEHVNERLILPTWLVVDRTAFKVEQQACDLEANQLLERRGISSSKRPGSLHGVAALIAFVQQHPEDTEAGSALDSFVQQLRRAQKRTDQAIRCIEKIYETVASRVCRLHSTIVLPATALRQLKRYKTRDLLKADPLPPGSREILTAAAPGKLHALFKRYGLASVTVPPDLRVVARETDLFTSWVQSLGVKTGTKPSGNCHRSQLADQIAAVQ